MNLDYCDMFVKQTNRQKPRINNKPFDPKHDMFGRSAGGNDTSITIPKLKTTLDAGMAISEIEPENNVFVSHTDSDHSEGLKSLMCMSIGRDKPYRVYISEKSKNFVNKLKQEKKNSMLII